MAFYKQKSQEDAPECPVCYESPSGTERTLSCGHVFCHDCLVKTLVSIAGVGTVGDTIACPVCRHLTFIWKQTDAALERPAAEDKAAREAQTLEVPVPLEMGEFQGDQRTSTDTSPRRVDWISRSFCGVSDQLCRQALVGHKASQVFIISAEGRPMAEEEALSTAVTATAQPQPRSRSRCRICTTARCLLVLLSAFTLLTLVAATLPWILLA